VNMWSFLEPEMEMRVRKYFKRAQRKRNRY
jgi:hypothetical protein